MFHSLIQVQYVCFQEQRSGAALVRPTVYMYMY